MSLATGLTDRAAALVDRRTSRRGFLGRSALVGSALTVAGPSYVLRPGSAYAAVTRTRCADCDGGLCCDGYTEFCCHLSEDGANECPPGTVVAGWWKVDDSDFCLGTARYYLDCNTESPDCACGSSGTCQDDHSQCGCVDCASRKDGCTVFRYGNCNNHIACVGPIMCRVVTCTEPWELEPTCSEVPRTDERTRHHHRPCLERDPDERELAFVRAVYEDLLGRPSDATGEAYWGNLLVRGAHLDGGGRDRVAKSFVFSDEYVGAVVDRRYRAAFDRQAEEEGREHWVGRLRDGVTPEELAVRLFASEEFFDASGRDPATFVERLYRRVLDREVADAEREHWVGAMGDTLDRRGVAGIVYRSEESRRVRVTTLYHRFLGRAPEDGGREHWVEVLGNHEDLTLALFLVSSEEYNDRAVHRFPSDEEGSDDTDTTDPGDGDGDDDRVQQATTERVP